MNRFCIKVTGESGAGLLSTGEILTKAFHSMGYYVCADREYPSLIKGGHSCFVINVSDEPVYSLDEDPDIILAIDRQSLEVYWQDVKKGGTLIYGYERPIGLKEIVGKLKKRGCESVHLMSREIAEEFGGNYLMVNVVLVGMLWKHLGLDWKIVKKAIEDKFASKPRLLAIDLKCAKAGFDRVEAKVKFPKTKKKPKTLLVDGNKCLALGAIHAGCRAYYAYPMSPASTILTHMSNFADETGVMVKQGEDEITVANMTLGSMFMGTRAMCATSGGGFDLMTETMSLAGIIETPLVAVIVQRPGPGTGLPTWTAQADLNMAIYSSHGEFPKLVIGCSDPSDCFELVQHAFNYAEKYQVVVLILSEKVIAESLMTVPVLKQNTVKIERGLVEGAELKTLVNEDRYRITKNGVSKRWMPGASKAYYFANGDEHLEDGSLTEDAGPSREMIAKRMRKLDTLKKALPDPEIYGAKTGADISFVGWGSSKNVMRDAIEYYKEQGVKVNYLHYSYVFPLKEKAAQRFFKANKNVHLLEGNLQGQFGDLLEAKAKVNLNGRLLKWDGRPFFIDDATKYIDKILK
jgi:2-oxoglutarate/2-oxoacid ferredoxin oxidoreductase subunit alpha